MKSALLAFVLAALTFGVWMLDPHRPPGLEIAPPPPIAVIETSAPPTPMEAALVLRAVTRFHPQSVTFLDPLSGSDGAPLLRSRLADEKIPVQFASATPPPSTKTPPPAGRISLDQLLLRIERSERGEISLDLDARFAGRAVYVVTAGTNVAPRSNALPRVKFSGPPPWAGWIGVALAASLPWWPLRRSSRALTALAVCALWLLAAVTAQSEFGVSLPVTFAPALPLLALIPPGRSRKVSD